MKKHYSEWSMYDNGLKQLDEDIVSNRNRKKQTRSSLLTKINKMERKSKKIGFNYVASLGAFTVLLFLGYQLVANDISNSNEQVSTVPDNHTENFLVLDDMEEADERERIGKSDYLNSPVEMAPTIDIQTILPTYVPGREHAEPANVVNVSDPVAYSYADYYHSDDQSFTVYLTAENRSIEDMMWSAKFQYRKDPDPIEEIEIAGHPAILRLEAEDVTFYSTLHIFVENHTITLTTHGIEKEEILKSANSMDLTKATIDVGETSAKENREELAEQIPGLE